MNLNTKTFTEILSLADWDEQVLTVLEFLELERPVVEKGEDYAYLSSKKFGIDIMFDYDCVTPTQKAMEASGSLYISQITFKKDTPLILPFNLLLEDNYNTVIEKLGRKHDNKSFGSNTGFAWDIHDGKKLFELITDFNTDSLDSLKQVWMRH